MAENLVRSAKRTLGPFQIGPLAFGCWRLTVDDVTQAQQLIESALSHGMNLIDNADVYGLDWGGSGFGSCESTLGKVLTQAPELRGQMVLATKGGIVPPTPYDQSPAYLRQACEDSLRRLNVETIDLYQIHRPDLFAHPEDVAGVLTALREEGKIREVGVSNFTTDQHETLASFLGFPIISSQPQYSAAHLAPMRDGTFDWCLRNKAVPLAWSPLGGGSIISGDGVRPELIATLDVLAEREETDRAAVALAFVLTHPSAPVALLGTQTPERLAAATKALNVTLTRDDCYQLIVASEGVPLP